MVKKARCKCARCGKVKYLPASGIAREEKFLCEPCDDKFIVWAESTSFPWSLEDFLKKCKSARN